MVFQRACIVLDDLKVRSKLLKISGKTLLGESEIFRKPVWGRGEDKIGRKVPRKRPKLM